MLRYIAVWLITITSPAVFTHACHAGMITYHQSAVASGSLGGASFTNAAISVIATANTVDISPYVNGIWVPNQSLSVVIEGVGFATFTAVTYTFVHFADSAAGAAVPSLGRDILDTVNSSLASYDLKSEVGPVVGPAIFNPGLGFATDRGAFVINSVVGDVTFRASFSAVPEPSGLVSSAVGLAALAGYRLRRCRFSRA